MTMAQLEAMIDNDLHRIGYSLKDKEIKGLLSFSETLGIRAPGVYVYVANDEFHFVSIGDRGALEAHDVYTNQTDFLFRVYWGITSSLSINYASQNKIPGKDWRRIMFAKQLEWLKQLGKAYYQRGKAEIVTILANAPYNDAPFQ